MSLRRFAFVGAITLAALLGVSTAAVAALNIVHRGEVLPGVSVEGVDVGGLSEEAARDALSPVIQSREADPVTFTFEDRQFVLDPAEVGYDVDLDDAVQRALDAGREGGFLSSTWGSVESLWTEHTIELDDDVDRETLREWIQTTATEVDADPYPGSVSADADTLEVVVEPPTPGQTVELDATEDAALAAFRAEGSETVALPVEVLPARVDPADVEQVAAQARRALQAPLTVRAVGAEVVLEPSQIAPMIELTEVSTGDDTWTVELDVPIDAVEAAFAEVAGRFEVAPTSARFDIGRAPPVGFDDKNTATWSPKPVDIPVVESTPGRTFSADLATDALAELLAAGAREGELPLKEVEAEFTTEDAREFNLTHLLGTFTTYHSCCQARVTNIQRLADMVDGTRVAPGEQFSINQISGERTCSKGFRPAGMILNGEIVDVCGGGVSQFGTTTFNAAFFAGLPLDAFKAHSFYISRYPMGREATLNYPSPDIDVKFTNDTGNGLLVKTTYTGTSITVSIYGNNDVESVTAVHGSPFNTKPFTTEYRENKELAPGTSKQVQTGRNGFTVRVTRKITRENGETDTREFTTVYVPERTIIERNTDPPPPPPSPSPRPQPGPSPSPAGG